MPAHAPSAPNAAACCSRISVSVSWPAHDKLRLAKPSQRKASQDCRRCQLSARVFEGYQRSRWKLGLDWTCVSAGAIETATAGSPVDIMLGIGGTPEGIVWPPSMWSLGLHVSRNYRPAAFCLLGEDSTCSQLWLCWPFHAVLRLCGLRTRKLCLGICALVLPFLDMGQQQAAGTSSARRCQIQVHAMPGPHHWPQNCLGQLCSSAWGLCCKARCTPAAKTGRRAPKCFMLSKIIGMCRSDCGSRAQVHGRLIAGALVPTQR